MFTLEEILKAWETCYGEDMKEEYAGFIEELGKVRPPALNDALQTVLRATILADKDTATDAEVVAWADKNLEGGFWGLPHPMERTLEVLWDFISEKDIPAIMQKLKEKNL